MWKTTRVSSLLNIGHIILDGNGCPIRFKHFNDITSIIRGIGVYFSMFHSDAECLETFTDIWNAHQRGLDTSSVDVCSFMRLLCQTSLLSDAFSWERSFARLADCGVAPFLCDPGSYFQNGILQDMSVVYPCVRSILCDTDISNNDVPWFHVDAFRHPGRLVCGVSIATMCLTGHDIAKTRAICIADLCTAIGSLSHISLSVTSSGVVSTFRRILAPAPTMVEFVNTYSLLPWSTVMYTILVDIAKETPCDAVSRTTSVYLNQLLATTTGGSFRFTIGNTFTDDDELIKTSVQSKASTYAGSTDPEYPQVFRFFESASDQASTIAIHLLTECRVLMDEITRRQWAPLELLDTRITTKCDQPTARCIQQRLIDNVVIGSRTLDSKWYQDTVDAMSNKRSDLFNFDIPGIRAPVVRDGCLLDELLLMSTQSTIYDHRFMGSPHLVTGILVAAMCSGAFGASKIVQIIQGVCVCE